jgi:hypothetical protein
MAQNALKISGKAVNFLHRLIDENVTGRDLGWTSVEQLAERAAVEKASGSTPWSQPWQHSCLDLRSNCASGRREVITSAPGGALRGRAGRLGHLSGLFVYRQ